MADMFFRKSIPADALRQSYVDEGWTIEQLAQHYRCGETTIIRRLRDLHIEIRPRGPKPGSQTNFLYDNLRWSAALAYAVGIIATDGNLSKDGRHLAIPSKDLSMLETIKRCLDLDSRISSEIRWFRVYYRLVWSDVAFYHWLLSIGLTPAKSKTLGALTVPDNAFPDFMRGVIDGDGSIRVYQDKWNEFKNPKYVYDRVYIVISSASYPFLRWLQETTSRLGGIEGAIIQRKLHPGHSQQWELKYAKKGSLKLLRWIYYAPGLPALERKRSIAMQALELGRNL